MTEVIADMEDQNSLSNIRRRIHSKSEHYFSFSHRHRDANNWRMFYGATDALLDASMAAHAYGAALTKDSAVNLLVCYGFLQAIYIQQDAVWTLSRSVNLKWRPNDDPEIKEIRDLRNRLTGHPARAGEKETPKRPSSAIISYHDISRNQFNGVIYFDRRMENVTVHVPTILARNEAKLAVHMLRIESEMDNQEREYRRQRMTPPLSNIFHAGFDYLIQRLRPDLTDEGRVIQAQTHAAMIRERIQSCKTDVVKRELDSEGLSYKIPVVLDGLDLIEKLIEESDRSTRSQNQIDVVCDGFETNMSKLRAHILELDEKLSTPIP